MTSYSGTPSLPTDAMRPMVALLSKKPSAMTRQSSESPSRVWRPAHSIIFSKNPYQFDPDTPRAFSTASSGNPENELALRSDIENSYVLGSSLESESSDSKFSPLASPSSTNLDGSSWAPLTVSQGPSMQGTRVEGDRTNEVDRELQIKEGVESHAPLAFQIPRDVLQKAKDATPGTKESFWSYKMYLSPENQEVKVHYCKSRHATERVAQYFLNERVIGFDIEWKPDSTKNSGIKNNVALIQLASEMRIALFHIAVFPKDSVSDLVAPTLKTIMEDPEITKVGVAIKADCTRLRNFLKIEPRGIFELSHLYKLVRYSSSGDFGQINKKLVSLATQVEEHLELPVFKGEVRGSDWTQPLSMEQIIYAATDAYANVMLYDTLESKRKQLQPVPPRPYHAELDLPIRLATGAVIPTTDDVIEDVEPDANPTAAALTVPASVLEAAAQNIQIEEDLEFNPGTLRSKSSSTDTPKESKNPTTSPSKPQVLINAESWAQAHRATNPAAPPATNSQPTVTFAVLRVYALWYYNPSLSIPDMAAMLRDPPLRTTTVGAYILDAVRLEKLPYQKNRLKAVLQMVPDSRNLWRYKGLWRMVE